MIDSSSTSVWKLDMRGTCSRYAEYMRFYADVIDSKTERRERKCPGCPGIDKKNNVIIIDGDCRFHLLRELSEIISYSSYIVVPDFNLMKYAHHEVIEKELELVEVYQPSMKDGDYRSIHVYKRVYGKSWSVPLPELLVCSNTQLNLRKTSYPET